MTVVGMFCLVATAAKYTKWIWLSNHDRTIISMKISFRTSVATTKYDWICSYGLSCRVEWRFNYFCTDIFFRYSISHERITMRGPLNGLTNTMTVGFWEVGWCSKASQRVKLPTGYSAFFTSLPSCLWYNPTEWHSQAPVTLSVLR